MALRDSAIVAYAETKVMEKSDRDVFVLAGEMLEALLDNVRSAWNVGAIFRTADAFGVNKLHLCGITPTPENPSVAKTALGADKRTSATDHLLRSERRPARGCSVHRFQASPTSRDRSQHQP